MNQCSGKQSHSGCGSLAWMCGSVSPHARPKSKTGNKASDQYAARNALLWWYMATNPRLLFVWQKGVAWNGDLSPCELCNPSAVNRHSGHALHSCCAGICNIIQQNGRGFFSSPMRFTAKALQLGSALVDSWIQNTTSQRERWQPGQLPFSCVSSAVVQAQAKRFDSDHTL